MSFRQRIRQHDEVAIPIVVERFKLFGFECFVTGTEVDSRELQLALRAQHDDTSLMMRFRPDRILISRGNRSLLCEVKSENKGYRNFAIEVESYIAAILWNTASRNVMHALVDLSNNDLVICCWLNEIPKPKLIKIPRRRGFPRAIGRVRQRFPDIPFETTEWKGGSGTPYFLLPKSSSFLTEFNAFVMAELLAD